MSEPVERNSFSELGSHVVGAVRTVFGSKGLLVAFGLIFSAITGGYAYLGGWDAGIARVTDLEKLSQAIGQQASAIESQGRALQDQGKQITTLADALHESAKTQRESIDAERKRLDTEIGNAQKRDIKVWRAFVLTNAPSKRADAYARTYDSHIGQGRDPEVAAYMTLGWGSVR